MRRGGGLCARGRTCVCLGGGGGVKTLLGPNTVGGFRACGPHHDWGCLWWCFSAAAPSWAVGVVPAKADPSSHSAAVTLCVLHRATMELALAALALLLRGTAGHKTIC